MAKGKPQERVKIRVVEVKSKALFGKSQMEKVIENNINAGWELASKKKVRNKDRYTLEFHYHMSPEEIAKEDKMKRNRNILLAVLLFACCGISYFRGEASLREERSQEATQVAINSTEHAYATQTATLWTLTPTFTPTLTPTETLTPTITFTPTLTMTPTITMTPSQTFTPSITPSPTITNTPRPTNTDSPTRTPQPTSLPSGTTYYSENGDVRVRECPQLTCDILGVMDFAEAIEIIDTNVDGAAVSGNTRWMQGVLNGQVVFVHSSLVSRTRPSVAPVAPQSFTNTNSSNTSNQSVAPAQPPSACSCGGGDTLNCSNFSRQSQAQACYNQCVAERGYDVHGLDGNQDGDACESLP